MRRFQIYEHPLSYFVGIRWDGCEVGTCVPKNLTRDGKSARQIAEDYMAYDNKLLDWINDETNPNRQDRIQNFIRYATAAGIA